MNTSIPNDEGRKNETIYKKKPDFSGCADSHCCRFDLRLHAGLVHKEINA